MEHLGNTLLFPVYWRVAVFPEPAGEQCFIGKTYELSPVGAGIYCDFNLPEKISFLLHLEIPAITKDTHGNDLEIVARVTHTTLHSQYGFRIGMLFQQFEGEGKVLLTRTLTQRFKPGHR